MISKANTNQLITWLAIIFTAQLSLASIHHVYGGLIYDSAARLSMPILAGMELLIVLGLLFWYRQTKNGSALALVSVFALLIGIVQGLFHTLYGHTYKDLLYLVGVPAERVRYFFLPVLPNDFVYPPNNLFFEVTGVLELVTISMIAILSYRLIRCHKQAKRT